MGDDTSIVQSARVSYGKGTKKVSTDEGLIKYLMRHWHSTPFEMCEIKKPIKITYCYSEVEMTLFNNRIATQYKKLPLCNPDFIYLDGPGQFNIKKDVNGISTRHNDMMPMVCDILKFEYFFTPGSIIVCDGRAANAKFLKDNFKRKWKYVDDKKNDQHIFWLDDPTLGKYNKLQIDFYKK
ncbi:FAD-dependent thymidylate synthase, partial [Candidatus Pelagibacter sp.]|nr:FAD-dependent thymidylate synthase [Candidatus Pelagibacter sp.]